MIRPCFDFHGTFANLPKTARVAFFRKTSFKRISVTGQMGGGEKEEEEEAKKKKKKKKKKKRKKKKKKKKKK